MPRKRQDNTATQRELDNVPNIPGPHLLTPRLLLRWCLLFRLKEGKWPGAEAVVWDRTNSGEWVRLRGESWPALAKALHMGRRGLAALRGATLGDLRRLHGLDPRLKKSQVAVWITDFRKREARWPNHTDDCVWEEHPRRGWTRRASTTWLGVSVALSCGLSDCEPMSLNQFQHTVIDRPAQPRLPRLIQQKPTAPRRRRTRSKHARHKAGRGRTGLGPHRLRSSPDVRGHAGILTESQLVTWIALFHEKESRYPSCKDRIVWEKTDPGTWRQVRHETWQALDTALARGRRGLNAWRGASLAQFRRAHGLHRDLTAQRLVDWIRAFREKMSRWPKQTDKVVWERRDGQWHRVRRETWAGINLALRGGTRGLRDWKGTGLLSFRRKHGLIDEARDLRDAEVTSWMQEFHRRQGQWPTGRDKTVWIPDTEGGWKKSPSLTWRRIDESLQRRRACGARTTLGRLKKKQGLGQRLQFSAARVERWIRLYHEKESHWPTPRSIEVWDQDGATQAWSVVTGLTWAEIEGALLRGTRGLEALRGSSLEKFRYRRRLGEPLSAKQILLWAHCFKRKTARYPRRTDTHVWEPDPLQHWRIVAEWTWTQINRALSQNYLGRGQPASLAELLLSGQLVDEGAPPKDDRRLTPQKIHQWLTTFESREGRWPTYQDREVLEEIEPGVLVCVVGENWKALSEAMVLGLRGLTELKGTRLTQFRAAHGMIDDRTLTPETLAQWMQDFRRKTGEWPTESDRTVWALDPATDAWVEVPGESWGALKSTLRHGRRGLKDFKGLSFAQFRVKRGLEKDRDLTVAQIVKWMRLFRDKEARWPAQYDTTVWESPRTDVWVAVENESWTRLDDALRRGLRGLEAHKGSSLAKVKKQHNLRDTILFTPILLKRWIRLYHQKEHAWPSIDSPAIWVHEPHEGWQVVEGESWRKVNQALIHGTRGLKELKGSSLFKFRQAQGLVGEGPSIPVQKAA